MARSGTNEGLAHAGAAVAGVLFGSSAVAVRAAVQDVPPAALALLRFGIGAAVLTLVIAICTPRLLAIHLRDAPALVALGACLFTVPSLAFNYGLQLTEASQAAIVFSTLPLWSSILAFFVSGERPSRLQFGGIFLCITGVATSFADNGGSVLNSRTLLGDMLLLVASISGAVYGVFSKRMLAEYKPSTVTTYTMLCGAGLLLPITLAIEGFWAISVRSLSDVRTLGLMAFLSIPCAAIAFLLWTTSLRRLGATQVGAYIVLHPISAAALGILLLNEQRGIPFFVGFAMSLWGIVMVARVNPKRGKSQR